MDEFNKGGGGNNDLVSAEIIHRERTDSSNESPNRDAIPFINHGRTPCLEEADVEILEIGFDGYIPRDGSWERYGQVIGRMQRLKDLLFYDLDEEVMRGDFTSIFRGISHNRTISKLRFQCCGLLDGDIFSILTPFFKNNRNFESLKIDCCDLGRDGMRFLTKALAEFDSLREFELSECREVEDGSFIRALLGHFRLRKLCLRETPIGKNGCAMLAALLQKPESELAALTITDDVLDDAMVATLERGIARNCTLKEIDFRRNSSITEAGWKVLFGATLQSPYCRLETLFLEDAWTNNDAEPSHTTCSKALNLSWPHDFGGSALSEFLMGPNCTLEDLHLHNKRFCECVTISLASSLLSNRTLKSLDLSSCCISNTKWRTFSSALLNPHSVLENLQLCSCDINDDAVVHIANSLASNKRLRNLKLCNNFQVTPTGWNLFFSVLQSPVSGLEKLDISGNNIAGRTMISLANSLVNNNKLIELQASLASWNITADGWAAFERMLCNKSSIMSTHHSNHTLRKLCQDNMDITMPENVESLLLLNRESNKGQAARLKIIKTHFTGSHANVLPFTEMDLKVIPSAIAWVARDCAVNTNRSWDNGFLFLYQFVQAMTSLFDFGGNGSYWVGTGAKRRKIMAEKDSSS